MMKKMFILQSRPLSCWNSFWWDHYQCLSLFILKESSHSVPLIKCRTYDMLNTTAVPLRSVDCNWNLLAMKKWKQWFCCFHVKYLGFVLPCFQRKLLSTFLSDYLFYTHQHLCMIECRKRAFVDISICPSFHILPVLH